MFKFLYIMNFLCFFILRHFLFIFQFKGFNLVSELQCLTIKENNNNITLLILFIIDLSSAITTSESL